MAAFSTCARVANLVAKNASSSVSSHRSTQRAPGAGGARDRRIVRARHAVRVRASEEDETEGDAPARKAPSVFHGSVGGAKLNEGDRIIGRPKNAAWAVTCRVER